MGEAGTKNALELIKAHQAKTAELHAALKTHVDPSSAAALDKVLAKHKEAQQGLADDAQGLVWTP